MSRETDTPRLDGKPHQSRLPNIGEKSQSAALTNLCDVCLMNEKWLK
jgi:hypothetical protein